MNVLVDIRKENEEIRECFKGKDLITVEELLGTIEDLLYEKHLLEEKLEDKEDAWEPDPYKVWRDNNG